MLCGCFYDCGQGKNWGTRWEKENSEASAYKQARRAVSLFTYHDGAAVLRKLTVDGFRFSVFGFLSMSRLSCVVDFRGTCGQVTDISHQHEGLTTVPQRGNTTAALQPVSHFLSEPRFDYDILVEEDRSLTPELHLPMWRGIARSLQCDYAEVGLACSTPPALKLAAYY